MELPKYMHLFQTGEEHRRQHSKEYSGYTEPWVGYSMDDEIVTYNINGYVITFDKLFDADSYDLSQTLFVVNTTTGANYNTQTVKVYMAQEGFDYNYIMNHGDFNYDFMLELSKQTETSDINSAYVEFFHGYEKYFQQPNAPRIIAEGNANIGFNFDVEESIGTHCPYSGNYTAYTTYDLSKSMFYMVDMHIRDCSEEHEGEVDFHWSFGPIKNDIQLEQPTEVPDKNLNENRKIDTQLVAYLPLYVGNMGEEWTMKRMTLTGVYFSPIYTLTHEVENEHSAKIYGWYTYDFIQDEYGSHGNPTPITMTEQTLVLNDAITYEEVLLAGECNYSTTLVFNNETVSTAGSQRMTVVTKTKGTYSYEVEDIEDCPGM